MHNDEAMLALVNQRASINGAINELIRYVRESVNWKVAVKTSQMAEVKVLSTAAGVDLSAWDDTPAPVLIPRD